MHVLWPWPHTTTALALAPHTTILPTPQLYHTSQDYQRWNLTPQRHRPGWRLHLKNATGVYTLKTPLARGVKVLATRFQGWPTRCQRVANALERWRQRWLEPHTVTPPARDVTLQRRRFFHRHRPLSVGTTHRKTTNTRNITHHNTTTPPTPPITAPNTTNAKR